MDLPEAWPEIDGVFARCAKREHVPGIAYGVVLGDDLVYHGGVGTLRAGEGASPDADSVFRIASITKSFTAATLMSLRDEGVLRLDDPLGALAPELAGWLGPTADSAELRVRDLMTMSAGLPEDDAWADRHLDASPEELDAWFAAASFAHPPGVTFEYSNLGWAALGRVVERTSGERAQELISRRFCAPLGMASTTWTSANVARERIAPGYRWQDDVWIAESPPLEDGGVAPMGGLWSTVRDLARWVAFLMGAFPPRDDPDTGPLRRSSRREMQQMSRPIGIETSRPRPEGPERAGAFGYGCGLFVQLDPRLGTHVGHSGGLPGWGSHIRWMPDRGLGVVALGNVTYAPMGTACIEALDVLADLDALPHQREIPPSGPLTAAVADLTSLLDRWDDDRARSLFADNVLLDDDAARRAAQAAALRVAHGPFAPAGPLEPRSALSGSCSLAGGRVKLSVDLNAQVPPRIQWYELVATDRTSA